MRNRSQREIPEDFSDNLLALSRKILEQALIEERLVNTQYALAQHIEKGPKSKIFNVPRDEEERQEWQERVRGMNENLSDDEVEAFIIACEAKDFTTAGALSFLEDKRSIEQNIAELQQTLEHNTVFEPYTMQMGFAPGALEMLRTFKEQGDFVTLVTTGQIFQHDHNAPIYYFPPYLQKQTQITLGQDLEHIFDAMDGTEKRSEKFDEHMKLLRIPPERTFAIGDDIHAISFHAALLSVHAIGINYQLDIKVHSPSVSSHRDKARINQIKAAINANPLQSGIKSFEVRREYNGFTYVFSGTDNTELRAFKYALNLETPEFLKYRVTHERQPKEGFALISAEIEHLRKILIQKKIEMESKGVIFIEHMNELPALIDRLAPQVVPKNTPPPPAF